MSGSGDKDRTCEHAASVWELTQTILASYFALPPSACTTSDEHISVLLTDPLESGKIDLPTAQFIETTFNGVLHRQLFCQSTLNTYCTQWRRNRQHSISMMMLIYMLVFCIDDIDVDVLILLVENSPLPDTRVSEMVESLSDETKISDFVEPWCSVYDDVYVSKSIVGVISASSLKYQEILQHFRSRATAVGVGSVQQPSSHGRSEVRLFSFMKREERKQKLPPIPPQSVRELEHIGIVRKYPRIQDASNTAERAAIEIVKSGMQRAPSTLDPAIRAQNRSIERSKPFTKFSASTPRQKSRLPAGDSLGDERQSPQPTLEDIRSHQQLVRETVQVRPTKALLYREANVYMQKKQEEERGIQRKEQEMRDSTDFFAWQDKQKAVDRENERQLVSQKRSEARAADEDAKQVRLLQQLRNQAATRASKIEGEADRERQRAEAEESVRRKRDGASRLRVAGRAAVVDAVVGAEQRRLNIAMSMRNETSAIEQQIAVSKELEKERKRDLIAEIKRQHEVMITQATEDRKVRLRRENNTLLTGQLAGMSLAELAQKLEELKYETVEHEKKRRSQINAEKERQREADAERLAMVERERVRTRRKKDEERAGRKFKLQSEADENRVSENARLLVVNSKLEEKRQCRIEELHALRDAERKRRQAAQLRNADGAAVERHRWTEMERGAGSRLLVEQNSRLRERITDRTIASFEKEKREKNVLGQAAAVRQARSASDTMFGERRRLRELQNTDDSHTRIAVAQKARENANATKSMKAKAQYI